MESLQAKIIISVARALLGEVFPAPRGVAYILPSENSIQVIFYDDGDIDEADAESISCVETEIMADFLPEISVEAVTERIDLPSPIAQRGYFIFRRREA